MTETVIEQPDLNAAFHELEKKLWELGKEADTLRDVRDALREKIKVRQASILGDIYNAINGDGKRKFSNEAMRQAEFDIRSASDKELSQHLGNLEKAERENREIERAMKIIEYELKARIASPRVI